MLVEVRVVLASAGEFLFPVELVPGCFRMQSRAVKNDMKKGFLGGEDSNREDGAGKEEEDQHEATLDSQLHL